MKGSDKKYKVIVITIMDEIFTIARRANRDVALEYVRIADRDGFLVNDPLKPDDTLFFQPRSIYKIIVRKMYPGDKCA